MSGPDEREGLPNGRQGGDASDRAERDDAQPEQKNWPASSVRGEAAPGHSSQPPGAQVLQQQWPRPAEAHLEATAPDVMEVRKQVAAAVPAAQLPTLGQAVIFFLMLAPLLLGGQYAALFVAQRLHLFGHRPFAAYAELAAGDARLGLPVQGFAYLLVIACGSSLFRYVWHRPLREGLHWNPPRVLRQVGWLVGLGLLCGLANTFAGNLLPMPKDPPILADMMRSPAGAWMMFVFGVTLAPALEETAFRGFLLPGFVHAFDWLVRKGDISLRTRNLVGVPVSVLLTTLPFALMHAPQVSHAWGPLLLIAVVSVVLCAVRLALDSLAASMLVHATYNFSLFAGILIQTGGFRHLDRLS